MQSHTSFTVRVSMEVDPKRVEHTSPDILGDEEKIFIRR